MHPIFVISLWATLSSTLALLLQLATYFRVEENLSLTPKRGLGAEVGDEIWRVLELGVSNLLKGELGEVEVEVEVVEIACETS